MTSEKEIEKDLAQRTKLAGGLAVKFVDPARRGAPDRILLFSCGRVVFVELKRADGKISALQNIYHAQLRELGYDVYVSRSIADNEMIIREVLES